jgi:hypothetical protein
VLVHRVGDDVQAEAGSTRGSPGRRTAGEPGEDVLALLGGNHLGAVIDREESRRVVRGDGDGVQPAALSVGVREKVVDGPFELPGVGPHDRRRPGRHGPGLLQGWRCQDRIAVAAAVSQDMADQLTKAGLGAGVGVAAVTGVEARQLQQVLRRAAEALQVPPHQVECLPRSIRQQLEAGDQSCQG